MLAVTWTSLCALILMSIHMAVAALREERAEAVSLDGRLRYERLMMDLELPQCHFFHILLVRASHKATHPHRHHKIEKTEILLKL